MHMQVSALSVGFSEFAIFKRAFNPGPAEPGYVLSIVFANSVDPDQLASEDAN